MARDNPILGTLTISSGQTSSTSLSTLVPNPRVGFGPIVDLIIYAPSALTGSVTVYVAPVHSAGAGDWKQLYVGGSAVTIPAGAAVVVPAAAFRDLRVTSGSAEGADRSFIIMAQHQLT